MSNKLKPLPNLPVLREDFCSQEMVDEITKYLEKEQMDNLLRLWAEEDTIRISVYYTRLDEAIVGPVQDEASKLIDVPTTLIGMVDLCYEISRRLRKAYNLPDVSPIGNSITPSIEAPYPELPNLQILESTVGRGLKQKQIDTILQESYLENPHDWYALAEAIRHNMLINILNVKFREDFLNRSIKHQVNLMQPSSIPLNGMLMEANMRLRKLANISDEDIRRICEPHNYAIH